MNSDQSIPILKRATWGSKIGFIFAVAGSAVGLANIWRFPYIVGKNGGAAFILLYLFFLVVIGFPVFLSEILIGRTTQTTPGGAFFRLGGTLFWKLAGKMTVLTGFLVSAFYSAVAGWILGYLVEAFKGNLTAFQDSGQPGELFSSLMASPLWGVSFHFLFLAFSTAVLYLGVRGGIERGNKVMMPLLFALVTFLMFKGLTLEGASLGLSFLLTPDWSFLTPSAIVVALGQAFFTLSVGQGTMVTYGSYLGKEDNLIKSCLPVVAMDTLISLMAAIAIFTIVFSAGLEPGAGPGLIFQTLPWVFSQLPGGYLLAVMFFLLVFLAALTSEISAMEPAVAYLMDEHGITRHKAVLGVAILAFLVGIPSALSGSLLCKVTFFGVCFLDMMDFLCTSILIPLGGFAAIVLVGWVWGARNSITQLKSGSLELFTKNPWLETYFSFCFKFSAPILIVLVLLSALGLFGDG